MRLVHKQPVYAEFLKGDNVVFAALVVQFFQLQFQILFQLLHLLDGESLRPLLFRLDDSLRDFVNLFLQYCRLFLPAQRDFFKLRVTDDNGVIVARGDSGAEPLAIVRFKVPLCRNQDICCRIKLQKFACPLFG